MSAFAASCHCSDCRVTRISSYNCTTIILNRTGVNVSISTFRPSTVSTCTSPYHPYCRLQNSWRWRLTRPNSRYYNQATMDTSPEYSTETSLSWINVGLALSFILFDVVLSSVLRLGVERPLVTSLIRCVIQLGLALTLLQKVFNAKNPWAVTAIVCECDRSDPDSRGPMYILVDISN